MQNSARIAEISTQVAGITFYVYIVDLQYCQKGDRPGYALSYLPFKLVKWF